MKLPTLDEFLADDFWLDHTYVDEPGFSSLYMRKSSYYIDGKRYSKVLQVANCNVEKSGQGTFTRFIEKLEKKWGGPILVEQVLSARFSAGLLRMGFLPVNSGHNWDEIPRNFAKHLEAKNERADSKI